jgi:hypothetical protein
MSQKFKSGNQVKNEAALNVQKFQMASPVIDGGKSLQMKISTSLTSLRQAPRWLLQRSEADSCVSSLHKQEGSRNSHATPTASYVLGHQEGQNNRQVHRSQSHLSKGSSNYATVTWMI